MPSEDRKRMYTKLKEEVEIAKWWQTNPEERENHPRFTAFLEECSKLFLAAKRKIDMDAYVLTKHQKNAIAKDANCW